MKRRSLNLNAEAWRSVIEAWDPPLSARLLWQSRVIGPLLSRTWRLQADKIARTPQNEKRDQAVVIVGYWRSGTTFLHELMASSGAWSCPTTRACMNPHSFLLGKAAVTTERRPMDGMPVPSDSPQEEEFALLGLGARSPYEAFLFPEHLKRALCLADPENLTANERDVWRKTFRWLCGAVSGSQGGRPLLLKSPPHGCRIPLIREVLPGCKFILVVRDPGKVFQSAVNMWRTMSEIYALTKLPSENDVREVVLEHRPAYERCLQSGLATLNPGEHTVVRYEDLVRNPEAAIADLYRELGLGGADDAVRHAAREATARAGHRSLSPASEGPWADRMRKAWADVFDTYSYHS